MLSCIPILGKMVRDMVNSVKYVDLDYCIQQSILYESSGGKFKIVSYKDSKNVRIKFICTGYETTVQLGNIKSGKVKDRYLPSVCGVGIVGTKYPISEVGVHTKEYELWNSMLQRCYSNTYKKKYPTYEGCKCSENFKCYEYFYEWCNKQIGFGNDGFELDKDLLIKGNKIYSEDSCIFIPSEINTLLVKRGASRGEHLIGVYWHKTNKAFVARVNKSKGGSEYLGLFNTEIEAFNAYKQAKESFVKEQANKWKSKIDDRAYEALMNYEVEIND